MKIVYDFDGICMTKFDNDAFTLFFPDNDIISYVVHIDEMVQILTTFGTNSYCSFDSGISRIVFCPDRIGLVIHIKYKDMKDRIVSLDEVNTKEFKDFLQRQVDIKYH